MVVSPIKHARVNWFLLLSLLKKYFLNVVLQFNKLTSFFDASVLLMIMNFVITLSK